MAERIKTGDINIGDTLEHTPFGKATEVLEVVAIEDKTEGVYGSTLVRVFEPKTGKFGVLLKRSDGETQRLSSINPQTGEIFYK
ncbi:MAG: hypothetical protein HYV90_05285 [Candidatus Woesebacteria bacterium]|nr:MAG: hypothetical protein HYV90_05285 [Candidatus Woesebacteria bacterium]